METPEILFEDNHLIAVNKPAGTLVQGDKSGDIPMSDILKDYIGKKYEKPGAVFLGVVHRIDRPVSGIVIFARTSKSLVRMNELFREKKIKKTYWAVVKNRPAEPQGTLIHFLKKNSEKNKSFASEQETPGSSRCWLDYKVLSNSDNYFLLEITPHTGRHHQIRVQLAAMGCPIKGDTKYGFDRTNENGSIHLHARSIEFLHPVKKETIQLTAGVPDDVIWKYFEKKMTATE